MIVIEVLAILRLVQLLLNIEVFETVVLSTKGEPSGHDPRWRQAFNCLTGNLHAGDLGAIDKALLVTVWIFYAGMPCW